MALVCWLKKRFVLTCSDSALIGVIYQLNQFFKLFLRHFLLYGESSTEQKTFLGSHSYWETCYQVTCSVPPFPNHQVEPISMEMSTRHLFFKFFLFVFHLFSIFEKKNLKKLLTSTLDIKIDSAKSRFSGDQERELKTFCQESEWMMFVVSVHSL